MVASLVVYATINDRLFGGLTPVRRVGLRATARPARTRSPSTSSGSRAWPRCGSTATSACCAGRPCSRSACSRPGCCGARGAPTSRGWSRRAPTPRRRRARARGVGGRAARRRLRRAVDRGRRGSRGASSSPGSRWPRRCAPGACATRPRTGAVLGALTLARRRLARARVRVRGRAAGGADHGTDAPLGPGVDLLPRVGGRVGVVRRGGRSARGGGGRSWSRASGGGARSWRRAETNCALRRGCERPRRLARPGLVS